MKKRYVLLAGLCLIGVLAVGCGKKDKNTDEITPTPTIIVSDPDNVVEMQTAPTGIDKSTITKVIGTKTASSAELVITNNTGLEISCFYSRPSGEEDWSDDYIDGEFTLKDKERALYYYDPSAKDEDGKTITKYDLKVSYTDEDEDECMFRNLTLTDIDEELKLNMEDGVPFVTYTSVSTKRVISTLEDAKARMGRTNSDDDEDNKDDDKDTDKDDEKAAETPTPTVTEEPTVTGDPTDTPQDPGDSDPEPDNDRDAAGNYIGSSYDALVGELGEANGSDYETDENTGAEIGYYYYDGYTVSTVTQDGQEIVTGVW